MQQLSIFEYPQPGARAPRARRDDPVTSKLAAANAAAFAKDHADLIHQALATPGNIYELAARISRAHGIDFSHVQVARRLPEMKAAGRAEPTDERRGGCRVWKRT